MIDHVNHEGAIWSRSLFIVLIEVVGDDFLDAFEFAFFVVFEEDILEGGRVLPNVPLVVDHCEEGGSSQFVMLHHADEDELVVG